MKKAAEELFQNPDCGHIFRIKGFLNTSYKEEVMMENKTTDEMEKAISLEDEFDLRQKKIKAVYDYEEENNIPEDFRTTSAEMEVISNEMLDKQYSLIEKGMNNVKPEKNPVVDYMKKNLNKNMLKGRELEL